MKVTVNGHAHEVSAVTLDQLLAELEFGTDFLATAVNSTLVHAPDRPQCRLADGDEIEVLSPRQGG